VADDGHWTSGYAGLLIPFYSRQYYRLSRISSFLYRAYATYPHLMNPQEVWDRKEIKTLGLSSQSVDSFSKKSEKQGE